MNPIIRIAGSGGFGGLLAALVTRATHVGMFSSWRPLQDVGAEVVFGVAAALFGVYLLTNSDQTHPRTLVFAVACGLAWQPIIAGTSAYVKEYTSGRTANSARQADADLSQGTAPASAPSVQAAATATTDAIRKLPQITDPGDRSDILNASKSVVEKVATNETVKPDVRIDALRSIGLASLKSDAPKLGLLTVQPLKDLADSEDPQIRSQAQSALGAIKVEATKTDNHVIAEAIESKPPI